MTLQELAAVAGACLAQLNDYTASRAALVRQSLAMRNVPGGPWRGYFVRREQALKFSVMATPDTFDENNSGTGASLRGVGIVRNENPHAPFEGFRLLDAEGNVPAPGTAAATAQAHYAFYLERTRDAVNALRAALPTIESVHVDGATTTALTRLRLS
jgi:hypothetical protein